MTMKTLEQAVEWYVTGAEDELYQILNDEIPRAVELIAFIYGVSDDRVIELVKALLSQEQED
jgi:hypothetical protein